MKILHEFRPQFVVTFLPVDAHNTKSIYQELARFSFLTGNIYVCFLPLYVGLNMKTDDFLTV